MYVFWFNVGLFLSFLLKKYENLNFPPFFESETLDSFESSLRQTRSSQVQIRLDSVFSSRVQTRTHLYRSGKTKKEERGQMRRRDRVTEERVLFKRLV